MDKHERWIQDMPNPEGWTWDITTHDNGMTVALHGKIVDPEIDTTWIFTISGVPPHPRAVVLAAHDAVAAWPEERERKMRDRQLTESLKAELGIGIQ